MRFLLLAVVLALPAAAQSPLGRRAPGFSLPDSQFRQHDIQDYRGKVVLIEFMRTDCPKCQELTKTLEQVRAKYGDKIQILSVVTAPPDNHGTVAKYVTANKITYPFLFDCGQMTASYLQITPKNPTVHFPHLLVIDKAGMIRRDLAEAEVALANITGAVDPLLR